jgi:hypothetical protein
MIDINDWPNLEAVFTLRDDYPVEKLYKLECLAASKQRLPCIIDSKDCVGWLTQTGPRTFVLHGAPKEDP